MIEEFSKLPRKVLKKAQKENPNFREELEAHFRLVKPEWQWDADLEVYLTGEGTYIYLTETKLLGQGEAWTLKLIEKVTKLPYRSKMGFVMGLHDNKVIEIECEESFYSYLTRGGSLGLDLYEKMLALEPKIGFTIGITKWANLSFTKSPVVQTFFGEEGYKVTENRKKRSDRLGILKKLLEKWKGRLYVHGPLEVNMCRPDANLTFTTYDLQDAVKLGARGLVVHCGSNTTVKLPDLVAQDFMFRNFQKLAKSASLGCPLLIENSAGEGRDVSCAPKDLISLYNRFSVEEKKKVGLCLDTQHAFSAGYDPFDYLKEITRALPGVVRLVHFNDSAVERGARHDLHAPTAGGFEAMRTAIKEKKVPSESRGYIGIEKMIQVAEHCLGLNIDLVTETGECGAAHSL